MSRLHAVQILEPHIPTQVVCPYCGIKQPFIKETEYWRTVKAPHLKHPLILKIRMVCAKCRNPDCSHKSFALSTPGIERYQRATRTLISEAVAGVVQDNSTLKRIAQRLSRSFNTTGSQATLHRWKQRLASQYNFPEILRELQFSGALSIDEYMPRRGGRYEQIAGDVIMGNLGTNRPQSLVPNHSQSPNHIILVAEVVVPIPLSNVIILSWVDW